MPYNPKVGDVIEYEGYIGIITALDPYVNLDWIASNHPGYSYRSSHEEADWCVPEEYSRKFKLICNVLK